MAFATTLSYRADQTRLDEGFSATSLALDFRVRGVRIAGRSLGSTSKLSYTRTGY